MTEVAVNGSESSQELHTDFSCHRFLLSAPNHRRDGVIRWLDVQCFSSVAEAEMPLDARDSSQNGHDSFQQSS